MATIISTEKLTSGFDSKIVEMLQTSRTKGAVQMSSRIIGLPFQYLDTTDIRPYNNIDVGRSFIENMIAEAPMLTITPGVSNYFNTFTEDEKGTLSEYINKAMSGAQQTAATIADAAQLEGRFYDFTATYTWYMSYVNLLCRVCAIYLGIGDDIVPGTNTTYKRFDWAKYENITGSRQSKRYTSTVGNSIWDDITGGIGNIAAGISDNLFGDYNYLKLYVDGAESVQTSFSNSTSQSQIAGLFDTVESLWKEINLLGGGAAISQVGALAGNLATSVTSQFDSDASSNLSKIIGLTSQVVQGSNILFPEIWGDSSMRNAYSFNIELSSPYGDPESVFLNILMPMMHILALGLPRQVSANSFTTPFLIQASLKGGFAVDLGIVTGISIDKGGSGTWNVNNLPNKVKISLEISDLYSNMMMTSTLQPLKFMQNNSLMAFLASSCAVDLMEPNLALKLRTIYNTMSGSALDLAPQIVHGKIIEGVRNSIMGWFRI